MTAAGSRAAGAMAATPGDRIGHRRPGTFRRLLGYVGRQRTRLIVSTVFLILGTVVMAFQPLLFGRAVNEFANGNADNAVN